MDIDKVAQALAAAERILIITGAGLSADSGLPTYRGLGGLYNGETEDGLPIEVALSGPTLRSDPALCWKYLAEIGRVCLKAEPNAGHFAIAELQRRKPGAWVLTQNIDGFHGRAGSPVERLIEIHGQLAPLSCVGCGETDSRPLPALLDGALPPRCAHCAAVLRPAVVLFEEMLPDAALADLHEQSRIGFDAVLVVGTSASFGYILEPVWRVRHRGGFVAEVNLQATDISPFTDVRLEGRAADVLSQLIRHISSD
ncbi:NAD-dependent protein deacylase [Pseudomonas stutzeri]|uniref:protein acetyllysine N-acetyltransferase n=1 Tax=Stutzerimonas stutzeri TaxID=316 RepID=A0A2N8S2D3_STUST|nr:NAD-dependent protein deacylase [Stutzerimonas stutzeri]MCQ4296349.1 NAD-dependent protein deacylase [Stutzerimonas stutzeri]PNF80785.1 NAD-dependent protein deacylase [Stutzerimonas stutzeri]